MLEIPEAIVISRQLSQTVKGKRIKKVITAASPHKFAWYFGEPAEYDALLCGRTIEDAFALAGRVEISAEDATLHFGDGVNLRYYEPGEKRPPKHQLLVEFDDSSALLATVAMYGMLMAYPSDTNMEDDLYYKAAEKAVSPITDEFDYDYFLALFDEKGIKMSAKAFLATQQRIPGLGNGVLQDILLNAKIHPKKKISTLSEERRKELFTALKSTLAEMTDAGGRDTEKDLFGNFGGYRTKLGKNNKLLICPDCGGAVKKEAYLGGSIYFCKQCQEE